MSQVENLITQHLDTWTQAIEEKSTVGRGSSNKLNLVGIQKLRELILEMAVRGLLVPQDPDDEPASVLLEKITAEKAQLIKEGKIKKPKALPEISEDEKTFKLPNGWEFCRVGNLLNRISNGFSGKQVKFKTEYPLTRIETISQSVINYEKVGYVETIPEDKIDYYRLLRGDILLSHINSDFHVGKTAIKLDEKTLFHGTNLILLRFSCYVDSSFYNQVLNQKRLSGHFLSVAQHAIGQSSINQGIINNTVAVVPPIDEQKRIVEKVDELMALCDLLEQNTLASVETHQALVETLLGELVNPNNTINIQQAWALIAENFDSLFTTEQSIETLKQTILQLAVMGKLVPQNPNDEPASELLKKIAAEKAQLIKQGKIKKSKPLPEITEEEKPFDLPNGWEWSRLPDLGELARGKSKHRPRNDPKLYIDGDIPLIQTGDVSSAKNTAGRITTYTAKYNQEGLEQSRLWSKGTLCITIAANIADSGIMSFDACFPDSVVGFTPFIEEMDVKYFDLFIRTAKADLETFAPSTAQKNINLQILSDLFVPLPPLNELNLIVSKVNELMTLCDQLKTQLQTAQKTQINLAQSIAQETLQ